MKFDEEGQILIDEFEDDMFKREFINVSDDDWAEIEEINSLLCNLKDLKVDKIAVEGALAKSKIAWKIAILSQAYIYRLYELGESCAVAWNNKHYIASLTLARGIIETGVVLCDLDEKVKQGLENEDLNFLDKNVTDKTFSTRIEKLLGDGERFKATNIMTFIGKKEHEIPGLKSVYDHLSECAHPNQFGHFQHYGDLDHSNGTVMFSNGKFLEAKFHTLLCAFYFIGFGYYAYKRLQESIEKVAELQHKVNPVKS